jgi:hypothetical protein
MSTWKTLLIAAPIAASLLATNNAQAGWGGHGGGGHAGGGHGGERGHFDRGGFSRHFDHHDGLFFGALGLGALLGGAVVVQQQYYAQPGYVPSGY